MVDPEYAAPIPAPGPGRRGDPPREKTICLVCSSGGHFAEIQALRPFWSDYRRFWVTFERAESELNWAGERVFRAHEPTNRHLLNFIRNFFLAWRILRRERPDAVLTTGAGVGVPFIYIGRMLGIRTVFLETLTRADRLSLSGRLSHPVAEVFLVQWPELARKHRKARYEGRIV